MVVRSTAFAVTMTLAVFSGSMISVPASATHLGYCGGNYQTGNKFWETKEPTVSTVLSRLPSNKRKTSGNIVSLNYARDSSGNLINQSYFNDHWNKIFGTSTSNGYGRRLAGSWAPSSTTSWGMPTWLNRKNLSECVVNGKETAICLGIPTGKINVSSLGHHSGWSIIDTTKLNGSVGGKACLVYEVMFSSNFDFKKVDGKLPGFTNTPPRAIPPNDHLCQGRERLKNTGSMFSTRLGFTDAGGSSEIATTKLMNNFKNDMFSYSCSADGSSSNNEFLTQMHAQDPKGALQVIKRGVWYRLEHEISLNTNYDSSRNEYSGATTKVWLYRRDDNALLQSFSKKDTFSFDSNRDGRSELYPLMPRTSSAKKVSGIFLSIQQGGNLSGSGPWKLDHVIALRRFGLFLK
jgi:hypothetical protein